MSKLAPDQITFGALAAESDIDVGLRDYFYESESFNRLESGEKRIALGNRGAGKSAVFKMIGERARASGKLVLELAPEDYSYELLSRVLKAEAKGAWAKHGAFTAAWKYLIYVLVMKAVTDVPGVKTGSASNIYKYLRDKHDNIDKNPIGTLISYMKRLEGVKLGKYEAGLQARELQKLYKLEEIRALLPDLARVCKRREVLVLVDELDKGWDASEDARAFVSGLFQAAVTINQERLGISVLLSLRKELYDNIPALYEDAQKYRDIIETITWDEPSLLELIAKRIAHSLGDSNGTDPAVLWNQVFAETLDYRQTKSFNYLVDRTLYRPRELIYFCSAVRENAMDQSTAPPWDYNLISEAENTYSEERLKDIAAEYRFNYPGLGSVFETFRGLVYTFDRDDLELHCLEIATGDQPTSDEAKTWITDIEPDTLIEILWSVGFLRAYAVGGVKARRRSGSSYLGPHQIGSLNLSGISRFHVHPMFRSFLGMKEKA